MSLSRRKFLKLLGVSAGGAAVGLALPVGFEQWHQQSGVWVDPVNDEVIGESIEVVLWLPLPGGPVTPNGGDIVIESPYTNQRGEVFHSVSGNTLTEFGMNNKGRVVALR